MVLTRPVTRTKISTDTFGHPVYDALIRTGITMTGTSASFPTSVYSDVPWNTVVFDSGGFRTSTLVTTIPSSKAGLYSIAYSVSGSTANPSSYMSVFISDTRYDMNGTGSGRFIGSLVVPILGGQTITFKMWNGSGTAFLPYSTGSVCDIYRVGL